MRNNIILFPSSKVMMTSLISEPNVFPSDFTLLQRVNLMIARLYAFRNGMLQKDPSVEKEALSLEVMLQTLADDIEIARVLS